MGKEIDLVRYRNDGDDFHVLWTARRALRILDPNSNLVAVAVEGVSEREGLSNVRLDSGLLVIDTAEYYGSEDLRQAMQVVYCQLKYSTTTPNTPWTVNGLKGTLRGFAERFTALCKDFGHATVAAKVRFRFISNRPISESVQNSFAAAVAKTSLSRLDKRTKAARKSLIKATGLNASEFTKFAAQVDLWGNQESRDAQARALAVEPGRYTVFLDGDASKRMKDLVREKTLSKSAYDKTINLNTLLHQFGLGSERELLPCESRFEKLVDTIPRAQEIQIAQTILASHWPVIIRAPGGVGKSILAQRLNTHLPENSEAVVFDGFAGGDYRNPRLYRHKHSRGLVHIANELARRGLCDVLIPLYTASEQQYLDAFRKRLEQAAAVVRARTPDAVVLIIVDAADNLGIAATDANEHSFARDLLQEKPPEGCHIVALARTERVDRYLKPATEIIQIDLQSFDLIESRVHLRQKFPDASDNDVETFHRFTDKNPRVQANALTVADDLASLRKALGPTVETVEKLIDSQLETALNKIIREQASSRAEIEPLLIALTALSPPVPIRILAKAAKMSEEAVRSFISDFANGRPIVIHDDFVQFHDEPVETWFRENFMGTPNQAGTIVDLLTPLAIKDAYVAAALPHLLHHAERYGELMRLALEGPEPETNDPVERREVLLQRVQYALKAALAQKNLGDAAKLLVRAGEEVAANDRQASFLMDHADLVSSLAGPNVVSDFIFRQRAWEFSEKGYAYCAAMLAVDQRNGIEAERFHSLALLWLKDWFTEQEVKPDDKPWTDRVRMEDEDIAAYAEAIRSLHGVNPMLRFMRRWRDWAAFNAVRIVVARLLDRGDKAAVEELIAVTDKRVVIRLAIILEMNSVCAVPPAKYVRSTVSLLTSKATSINLDDYPAETEVMLAVVATAEAAIRSGVKAAKVLALLRRYTFANDRVYQWIDRGGRRETVLRAAALNAVLRGQRLTLDDVTSISIRKTLEKPGAENDREVREFKEVYGALVPWYGLRALAIVEQIKDWKSLVTAAQKECRTERWGWGNSHELRMAVDEISIVWFESLTWAGHGNNASAAEIEKWLEDQRVSITIPTWTVLSRRAAHHRDVCRDGAMKFAQHAREMIESEHGEARQTADSFAALARATLPLGHEEAAGYFQKALEHLSRLGDELHERLFSILTLAEAAAKSGQPNPCEAYRVARMGELFHAYNDHKFPWADVIDAVTKLCPASGFAIISRWKDRSQVSLDRTLPWVVLDLVKAEVVRPTVAAALHAFGGYWQLHKQAALFLEKESDRQLRQTILDTLVSDHEFDPDNEENAADALLDAAKAYGLEHQRLQAFVDFHAKFPDPHKHRSWQRTNKDSEAPPKLDWSELLDGIDVHTPEGVDEAATRRQATKMPSDSGDFLARMRGAVNSARRPEHVLALARSQELMISMVLDGLEACAKDWGASLAVKKALVQAVNIITGERAQELVSRGWALDETIRRCINLSGLTSPDILNRLMRGLAERIEYASAGALFNLAAVLAGNALSPEQAKNALVFALDRLELVLKADDGDGPWRETLTPPPEISRAVAGFLYAMLASPETEMRWRAVHAVRRLCRFGESQIVADLVSLLSSESLPAFTDAGLPFYAMHARLYLFVALARAAEEAPQLLTQYAPKFARWALDETPHVLIRHFAAQAALQLERSHTAILDQTTINRLTAVNVSPFSAKSKGDDEPRTVWNPQTAAKTDRFSFDYDFDRYWLGPLAEAFGIPHPQVAARTENWIVDKWNMPGLSAWSLDPRAKRNIYRGQETYASHGSYPNVDRYSFYLSYHAMFCVAGELLAQFAPSTSYGKNDWEYWLSRHILTRPDGKWLADGRDVEPLEARRWQLENEEWERRAEWQYSVLVNDFDQVLGIDKETTQRLAIWGSWFIKAGERQETVRISSALVTPRKSIALLRALQTANNSYEYKIPEERDDLEIDLPGFHLCGWISEPHNDHRLDQFDPFAGKIPWPGPRPGRRVRRLFKLIGDVTNRIWCINDMPAITLQIWGSRKENRYRSAGNHGQRLDADLDFLLGMLRRLDRDLIIEAEIEHDHGSQEKKEIDFAHRQYTRIYLLQGEGQIHTLYGGRHLRPKTS